jgi:hypothetical protein
METLKLRSIFFFFSWITFSCTYNQIGQAKIERSLVVGQWNSYEIQTPTGFAPGTASNLTLMYENGMVFTADGKFGPRYYNNGIWTESLAGGTYRFTDDKTLVLLFFTNTKDEFSLPLQIIKLDSDHLWFQHSFWVNEQNSLPTEVHLARVK